MTYEQRSGRVRKITLEQRSAMVRQPICTPDDERVQS